MLRDPYITVPLIVVILALWYIGNCWWFPFARCRRCDGAGRFMSSGRSVWRICRRCRGSGSRLRVGRRVWNYFAQTRANAK
jgi:hypothetical protein